MDAPSQPTWSTWREIPGVVGYPPHLRRTLVIAVVVGTILFAINQLDVVMRGDASTATWIKSALTYVVPFLVANSGIVVASRVDREDDGEVRRRWEARPTGRSRAPGRHGGRGRWRGR